MKQRISKLLAVVLAMVMLATVGSLFAFAVGEEEQASKKGLNYLIIGDSIAAGYGMHPNNGNPDDLGNQFTLHHGELVERSSRPVRTASRGAGWH